MSSARMTIDGLWRCLCPSVDGPTLSRAISAPYRSQLIANGAARRSICARSRPATTRPFSTSACLSTLRQDGVQPEEDAFGVLSDVVVGRQDGARQTGPSETRQRDENPFSNTTDEADDPRDSPASATDNEIRVEAKQPERSPVSTIPEPESRQRRGSSPATVASLVRAHQLEDDLRAATAEDIYDALRILRDRPKSKDRNTTAALVKHLLASGTAPNTLMYETLLMAHASPDGSADTVRALLREMQVKMLPWSSTAYHAALRALAIHPDYLVRNTVIKDMKERWIEITPEGHQSIAIGLLRDEQYELALEKLDEMMRNGVPVEPWVYDIFIYVFGRLDFLDDALRLARHRLDSGSEVPVNIWYFLLDVCSKGQNLEATTYVWNRAVKQGIVNPSDGVALNALNAAAVYGDTELCTQIIEYLASRGTRLSRHHYEALIDAYATQGNIEKVLEVYCIMHVAGVEVTHSSAGSLSFTLNRDPSLIDKAIQVMSGLKEKHDVPVTIFNALLNEIVKAQAESPDDAFAKALDLYRRVREFVPAGPDWHTFRNLLWKCTRPELAQFFVGEMFAFNIKPNLAIMKHVYRIHVEFQGPSHRAKEYFFKLAPHFNGSLAQGLRKAEAMDLSVKLIRRLIGERDPEAWRILEICQRNGLGQDRIDALRAEVETGRVGGVAAMTSRSETNVEESESRGRNILEANLALGLPLPLYPLVPDHKQSQHEANHAGTDGDETVDAETLRDNGREHAKEESVRVDDVEGADLCDEEDEAGDHEAPHPACMQYLDEEIGTHA
ncbi:hypothetical protein VMCG_02410 [Cytospora schulzeri]|uniref:Pentatricopeptide repeat-containing protein-mitochondrial domain-containing protein n=1 Tax=Cytospora schulzeri TaxID=448051 RepID=A0A423X267_9PEZI|nr:hypothetical protein VMCG_02410 [Valsa malicola]